jgi:flagellar motor switch protein FliN/FliY
MPELTPEIVAEVLAACQAGAAETSEAFSRTFGILIEVSPGEAGSFDPATLPEGFDGPGLAVVLTVGETAAVAMLPESSGLIPEWYADPDPTGESKLTTLAQKLGMLLLPEDLMPEQFAAGHTDQLSAAIERGSVAEGAALLPLQLKSGDTIGTLYLIWPAGQPEEILVAAKEEPAEEAAPEAAAPVERAPKPAAPSPPPQVATAGPVTQKLAIHGVEDLPPYGQSLLRVDVPVSVTLAAKKAQVDEIVELGPGSLIAFDKACDETLDLYVGQHHIAVGEAVKVGDKFGLRITAMRMPDERFNKLRRDA